jgi:hypothetical protein
MRFHRRLEKGRAERVAAAVIHTLPMIVAPFSFYSLA